MIRARKLPTVETLSRSTPTTAAGAPSSTLAPKRILGLPVLEGVFPVPQGGFVPQLVAGLTLAALGVPEVMGYARIGGMPVVTGLYTILLPISVFAVFCSSRHLVVGADSATAAIMAGGLAGMAALGSARYVGLAGILALITAGLLVLGRLLRLGFIADFLSRSVLIGFLTGVGIEVAIGQLAPMLGVSAGHGGTLHKLVDTLRAIPDARVGTVVTSVSVIVVIVGLRMVSRTIPGALIAVVGAIAVSWIFDLSAHGVSDLGKVPGGLPNVGFPNAPWGDVPNLVATALSIFVVILAQSAATSRAYAARYEEQFDENLDMGALGLANLSAGLTGTFVVNGSPTKTEIADAAGGRSQITTLTTGAVVLLVLLFLTGPLQYLPNSVLGAVVFLIGIQLVDITGLKGIRAAGYLVELGIALVTAATVIAWGVEEGIILAIVLSVIAHLRRSYSPRNAILVADGMLKWVHAPVTPAPQVEPGLVVYRWGASLYFANAARFEGQVLSLTQSDGAPVSWVCVDAVAMADVDYSGSETLIEANAELKKRGVRLVLAGVDDGVRKELDRAGVTAQVGEESYFDGVEAVAKAFRAARR